MKKMAMIFGVVLLLSGIAGFIPALTPDGKLLGVFATNGVHNAIHIVTGLAALAAGAASDHAARLFFRIFGVVYALVAVLGMVQGDQPLLGIVAHNMPDMWLHVAIAAFALYCGFARRADTHGAGRGPTLSGA